MNHQKSQRGFTLIELMLVCFIISILAAIAVPAYQEYLIRAKLAEVFEVSGGIKKAIADYYAYHGVMPKDNQALFLAKPEIMQSNRIKSMTVENGAIHIVIDLNRQPLDTVSIRPSMLKASLNDNIPSDYLFWLYGNCPLRNAETMVVSGVNKTSPNLKDSWLKC